MGDFVICSQCVYWEECEMKEDRDGCYFGETEDNLNETLDTATEIERLNKQIMNMAAELKGVNRSRCGKCVYELYCSKDKDKERKCPDYKRDAPDGGCYG